MTAVALLREHLTEDNHREVLDWAEGRRKREVEVYVRSLDPKPDVASSLRRLAVSQVPQALPANAADSAPARGPSKASTAPQAAEAPSPLLTLAPSSSTWNAAPVADERRPVSAGHSPATASQPVAVAPARRAEIQPLSPARYSLHLTISEETRNKLQRARDLLRHTGASDPADVFDRALTLLVAQLERKKAGAPGRKGGQGTDMKRSGASQAAEARERLRRQRAGRPRPPGFSCADRRSRS